MFTVLIPVGPDDADVLRLADTLDSLRAHETAEEIRLVLVDDSPRSRPELTAIDWPLSPTVIRTALWNRRRKPYFKSALIAGAMEGLREAGRTETDFCLKMDTDALVIAPFADKIRAAFTAEPGVGMVGSYDRRCTGEKRDWAHKGRVIASSPNRVHTLRWATRYRVPTRIAYKRSAERERAHQLIDQAVSHGYELGAHCLGGAYAISPAVLERIDLLDYRPWIDTWDCGEDITVSLIVFAAGAGVRGMVDQDEPFGLAWQGLPATPEWLVGHGSSLIHSTKDFQGSNESELREWFRAQTRARRPRSSADGPRSGG